MEILKNFSKHDKSHCLLKKKILYLQQIIKNYYKLKNKNNYE